MRAKRGERGGVVRRVRESREEGVRVRESQEEGVRVRERGGERRED